MAIAFTVVDVTENCLIMRATATAAADTGTISNADLKTNYKDSLSTLGRILHSTNTTAGVLKKALDANPGSVMIRPENNAAVWAVNVTEGAGPAFAVQLDVEGGAANTDTALIYIKGGPSNAI